MGLFRIYTNNTDRIVICRQICKSVLNNLSPCEVTDSSRHYTNNATLLVHITTFIQFSTVVTSLWFIIYLFFSFHEFADEDNFTLYRFGREKLIPPYMRYFREIFSIFSPNNDKFKHQRKSRIYCFNFPA